MLRSNKSIVIALANTGRERTNKKVVRRVAQIKREVRSSVRPKIRIIKIVEIKLILPKIDLTPAK